MKIYVISLESSHERKVALKEAFPQHYEEFIFINAVDGRNLTTTEYFKLVTPNLYENNRLLSPAEVGCALSHMQVYEKIIQENAPAIILEDDVIGNDQALEKAIAIAKKNKPDEVIFLGGYDHIKEANNIYLEASPEQTSTNPVYEVDKLSYIYLGSTCCYAIGANAARVTLNAQKQALKLADSWYNHTLNSNVKFKFSQLLHHPPFYNGAQHKSDIETERKSLSYKKTYKLFEESILLNLHLEFIAITHFLQKTFCLKKVKSLKVIIDSQIVGK